MEPDSGGCSYKVIVVGRAGVGKTSIVQRYSLGYFREPEQTIGVGYVRCEVGLDSGTVVLNVWDTAGQERFQSLIPLYLRGAHACILVFDVADEGSGPEVGQLYAAVEDCLSEKVSIILCGNKLDLLDRITDPPGIAAWADAKRLPYLRTSAVTGEGLEALFNAVAHSVIEAERKVATVAPTTRTESAQCCPT